MEEMNKGCIWHKEQWKNIFKNLTSKKYNPNKSWWIEKVFVSGDSLFSDDVFSHYQLACEEGYKNKIPERFNNFIQNTFIDERYITEKQ